MDMLHEMEKKMTVARNAARKCYKKMLQKTCARISTERQFQ